MRIIKAKKFILRPSKQRDLLSLYNNLNNKKIIFNLATVPWPLTLKDEKAWLKKTISENRKKKPETIIWAIVVDNQAVGSIGLHGIKEKHKAEIGYWLGEDYWGQGIITEVIKLVTKYGFDQLKLKRIFAKTFSHNKGSMRVLEKAGYKYEGILKKNSFVRGKAVDDHIFARINK